MKRKQVESETGGSSRCIPAELTGRRRFHWNTRTLPWIAALFCLTLGTVGVHARNGNPHNPDSETGASDPAPAKAAPHTELARTSSSAQPVPAATPETPVVGAATTDAAAPEPSSPANKLVGNAAPVTPIPLAASSTSPAGQFAFFSPNGTTLSSSPVVTWDDYNQQVIFTPNITSGAQDFMDWVSPVGPNYCAGAPGHHLLQLDVDGTLYLKGLCGVLRNEEILDNQGNITFFGSTAALPAGGFAVDYSNGDTCVVYINHDGTLPSDAGTCGDRATRYNNVTGLATQYAGLPSRGSSTGFPFIVSSIDTTLAGSVADYTLYTTAANGYGGPGLYRLEVYIVATSPAEGATLQFAVSYNDGQANQTLTNGPPVWFNAQGDFLSFSQPFYVAANTPIAVSTVATNSPTYHAVIRLLAE
jgi:hypothetical protein